jgi:hypothetical protein
MAAHNDQKTDERCGKLAHDAVLQDATDRIGAIGCG